MIKPEQIPDEVWKLVQLCTGMSETAARGLAAGVISTWPWSVQDELGRIHLEPSPHLTLPLTQENEQ